MAITLQELAKKLGVSPSTISRVANNKSFVKPETRKKILKAIDEYNYTPNQIARSLKVKVTKTVAVVVPDISEDFFSYVIKGIDEVLSQNGYTIILCDTGENSEKEDLYLNMLMQKQIDGIILATVSKDYKTIYKILESKNNMLFFDNLPNIKMNYDSVITDNIKASSMVVEHLIGLGHKKIGIITGKQNETTGFERLMGYKKALIENNIPIDEKLICIGDFKEKSGYESAEKLMENNKDMTALYVASSKMTYGAIKALNNRGKRIPSDIALVGFDVHDPTGLISPGITTIIQNEENIGKTAGEFFLKKMESGNRVVNQKILLDPQLVIRESCGYKTKHHGLDNNSAKTVERLKVNAKRL